MYSAQMEEYAKAVEIYEQVGIFWINWAIVTDIPSFGNIVIGM